MGIPDVAEIGAIPPAVALQQQRGTLPMARFRLARGDTGCEAGG
jgi:hypothetical protein